MKRTDLRTGTVYGYRSNPYGQPEPVAVLDARPWVALAGRDSMRQAQEPTETTLPDGTTVALHARLARGGEKSDGVLVRSTWLGRAQPLFITPPRYILGELSDIKAADAAAKAMREQKSQEDVERVAGREEQRARLHAAYPDLDARLCRQDTAGRLDMPRVEVDLDVLLALLHLDGPVDDRVRAATDAAGRLFFTEATHHRTSDEEWLPTAPMRWLLAAALVRQERHQRTHVPVLVLTPAGQAALDAHSIPTKETPMPAPARKLAPGRLAALRLASTGMVKLSSVKGSRPWFTDLTPHVRYRSLDSTPFRWLLAQELVETTEVPNAHVSGSHRRLALTPAGTAALTAHPEETPDA